MQVVGGVLKGMMRKEPAPGAGAGLRSVVCAAKSLNVYPEVRPCKLCRKEIWIYDFRGLEIEERLQVSPQFYVFDRLERDHRRECGR